jgi:cbb3-type cytochrome oxidase subunit 3
MLIGTTGGLFYGTNDSFFAVSFFILGLLLILVAGVLFTFNRQLQRSDF